MGRTKVEFIIVLVIIMFYLLFKWNNNFLGAIKIKKKDITKVKVTKFDNAMYVETEDKQKINELISILNRRVYGKSLNQKYNCKQLYFVIDIYGNKSVIILLWYGNKIYINGVVYEFKKDIPLNSLYSWYNSLESREI